MSGFRDLQIYQRSYVLAIAIHKYCATNNLETSFSRNLVDKVLRSSKSIPANIGEGYGKKKFKKDFLRYLWIAIGSKDETLVHLDFLKDLNYLDTQAHKEFSEELEQIGKMIFVLTEKIYEEIENKKNS